MELTLRLDVGCGSRPKGDVNVDFFKHGWNRQEADQDKGEYVNPHSIPNFVVASAEALPFRSGVFDVAYSSHTIEHVYHPFKMLRELARVSKRKVVVKCPHCGGSGAKRPFHVSYLDEAWFSQAASKLGFPSKSFITVYDDGPVTSRLYMITPRFFKRLFSRNIPYRIVRKVERAVFSNAKIPLEVESQILKQPKLSNGDELVFVVVHNNTAVYNNCFKSGAGVKGCKILDLDNKQGFGLGFAYNALSKSLLNQDLWLAFCHQDFILKESLYGKLFGKNKLGVYGVIGSRLGAKSLLGEIVQTDGSTVGARLTEAAHVDTLDEVCLIVHTEALRGGLRFDERFKFHYYGADLCMQAHRLGFDVMAFG